MEVLKIRDLAKAVILVAVGSYDIGVYDLDWQIDTSLDYFALEIILKGPLKAVADLRELAKLVLDKWHEALVTEGFYDSGCRIRLTVKVSILRRVLINVGQGGWP